MEETENVTVLLHQSAVLHLWSLLITSHEITFKGSFILSVSYGDGRSLLSVLCVPFVRISACYLKAYGYVQNGAVPPQIMEAE